MNEQALSAATKKLIDAGYTIEPDAGVPGLYWVNGRELTIGQIIHLASELPSN